VTVTLVQVSDIHFGRDVELAQLEAIERFVATLRPHAVVLAGDVTQRARHGEFQAAVLFRDAVARHAPVLAVPGNHDVQWWESPLHLLGRERIYRKYRRDFCDELRPVLELDGVVIAGLLSANGVSAGSLTWRFWRDTAVKGDLPAAETERVRACFAALPARVAKVAVLHHNVLRGALSRRMGLAHWRDAQARLAALGADVILCGHDHQEGAALLHGRVPVSTSSTHTHRTRGGRPSAFNVVRITDAEVLVQHVRWDAAARAFRPVEPVTFARPGR